ncbi:MAG: hypothetical protein ACI9V1_002324 [Spirosomataceae bacterium]
MKFTDKIQHMMRKETEVAWKWGNGSADSKVVATHEEKITRKLKGSEVTRKGSKTIRLLK